MAPPQSGLRPMAWTELERKPDRFRATEDRSHHEFLFRDTRLPFAPPALLASTKAATAPQKCTGGYVTTRALESGSTKEPKGGMRTRSQKTTLETRSFRKRTQKKYIKERSAWEELRSAQTASKVPPRETPAGGRVPQRPLNQRGPAFLPSPDFDASFVAYRAVWIRHSAFTKTMQVYGLSPSPPKHDVPVGSTFTTSPMQTALACSVAESLASLTADARSLSCAVPEPDTHIVSSLASAIPIAEATKAAIIKMFFFMIVISFSSQERLPLSTIHARSCRARGNEISKNYRQHGRASETTDPLTRQQSEQT